MQDLEEKEGRVTAPGLGGAMPVGTVSAKKPAKRIFGVRASTLFLICYIAAYLIPATSFCPFWGRTASGSS